MSIDAAIMEISSPWSEPELAVARAIVVHGPISRTAIAERLGLSQSTLTRLVKPLLAAGFVDETSEAPQDRLGRPSKPLVARAESATFVGIKLTGDEMFGVAVDLRADELAEVHRNLGSHDPRAVVDAVVAVVDDLKAACRRTVEAVGISLGGQVADGRTVQRAPFLDWKDVPLATMVEERLGVGVVVDNDVVALAAAEHWFGEGRDTEDFAVVTIGAGVGLGLVRGDQVVRSRDVGLGPAGHVILDPFGPLCARGHRGCATSMLTIPSMVTQYSLGRGAAHDFESLIDDARLDDPLAMSIAMSAGVALGKLLGLIANLAMVEVIIVTGDGLPLIDLTEREMREQLDRDRDPDASPIDLRIDRDGFTRWARGAAAVAIQHSLPRILGDAVSTAHARA